jgi:hypothetical protein
VLELVTLNIGCYLPANVAPERRYALNVSDLVLSLALAGLAGFSVTTVRRAWRDPDWRPFGQGWRFSPRAVVARAVILVSATVILGVLTVASATSGSAARAITAVGGLVGIVGVLAGGVLALTLTSFGRPASLVPPSLRAGTR